MLPSRTRRHAVVSALAATVLAAGCASSPPANYYTLTAPAAAGSTAATATIAASGATLSIAVGPVTLPAIVDRPQIVVSAGANAVRIDELNRWAAPLPDNIARVVAAQLATRLATPRVHLYTQSAGSDAQYRVTIDVGDFSSAPGNSARIDAQWTVRRVRDGQTQSGRSTQSETPAAPGYAALAAAHSRALERIASEIGAAIASLERQPPAI